MANREELAIIRGARAGRADAQLALGKRYLFGSAGLPQSLPTALHWLDRAARQGCLESCQLIGNHVPLDLARQHPGPLAPCYERAYDAGNIRAGLVLAQLLLEDSASATTTAAAAPRAKALRALEDAARAGFAEAQWLLARQPEAGANGASAARAPGAMPVAAAPAVDTSQPWLRRAADNGLAEAQFALLEQSWKSAQWQDYLERALPLARSLARDEARQSQRLTPGEVSLLSRVARLLERGAASGPASGVESGAEPGLEAGSASVSETELHTFWELAAAEHDRHAQLAMGLWYARMQVDGTRVAGGAGAANFKKAIRWLLLAGEQGLAAAWYALSRIYIKPEFSQRNVTDAQRYLERAAEMGYRAAQLECGNNAWRARRENENNDVRAVYWLQQAAAGGCPDAAGALHKIAPRLLDAVHTETGALLGCAIDLSGHPLLGARLELAALFGLSRAEALLVDLHAADQGHCLVIDIRASYGRSKRRLVMIDTAHERQSLDRIVALFDNIDCGPGGPEGNYRQRLYRLRTVVAEAGPGLAPARPGAGRPGAAYGMAA